VPKLLHVAVTTANLIIYKGVYDDSIKIWDRLVSASRNAYNQDSQKALAYEIAEQTSWAVPDVVVAPVAVARRSSRRRARSSARRR
jgi:threonine synthase